MVQRVAPLRFSVTIDFTAEKIKGLLCSALEGGSNYWYMHVRNVLRPGLRMEDFREGGKFQTPGDYWHPLQLIPLERGCASIYTTEGVGEDEMLVDDKGKPKEFRLDREAIMNGLRLIGTEYPAQFARIISGDDDAETGDVFLQLCLFGKLIYG